MGGGVVVTHCSRGHVERLALTHWMTCSVCFSCFVCVDVGRGLQSVKAVPARGIPVDQCPLVCSQMVTVLVLPVSASLGLRCFVAASIDRPGERLEETAVMHGLVVPVRRGFVL